MQKFILSLFLLFSTSAYAASLSTFCDSTTPEAFEQFGDILDNKDALQQDLVALGSQHLISDLLDSFNATRIKLAGKSSNPDFIPVFHLVAFCEQGFQGQLAEIALDGVCPEVDVEAVDRTLELALTAKAILGISDSPSTSLTNKVKNSKIDAGFQTAINQMYEACGNRLTLPEDIEPPIIEDPEFPETPGFCSTSPFANLTDFLWKPVSERNGKLVILTNPASSVTVNGETLVEFGASNGFCSTLRASKSGASYREAYVTVTTANRFYVINIPNGIQRYDCKGSLSNCGITVYDDQELNDLYLQAKKLKKKMRSTDSRRRKNKLKKQFNQIKPILLAAKAQGFF